MSTTTIRKPGRASKPAASEAGQLVRKISGELSAILSADANELFTAFPRCRHLDRAGCILGRVADPQAFDPVEDAPDGDVEAMLQAAKASLKLGLASIERNADKSLCGALHDGILAQHIHACLGELIDAYSRGPDYIRQLAALTTYRGILDCSASAVITMEPVVRPEGGQPGELLDLWEPVAYAEAVALMLAQQDDVSLTWALHRVIAEARDAVEEIEKQPGDDAGFGRAHRILREAAAFADFCFEHRDVLLDGAIRHLLHEALGRLEAASESLVRKEAVPC
ncbi:hypothetical protein [Pseudorhodoferax sp.]|uniref:hypothetical protein n=1 Tax=Pseudorhodoferax sp. TaxID=1993553 RepID=UPI0039E44E3C